jgi:predicted TIM-barrel fold metal-dependent hydrolase
MPEMRSFLKTDDAVPYPTERVVPKKSWRPPPGVRMISADDHILEPEHLWQERMPAKWKDRAPKYWFDQDGWHFEAEGRSLLPPGIRTTRERGVRGFYDLEARLAAMDEEGIEASVLYGGRISGLNGLQDADLFIAAIDTYNEWIAEHTRRYAHRLLPVALLPAWKKPEIARDRMQMIKSLGFRAVQLPTAPRGVRYNSRDMDGLFSAVEESGLPLSFHITATTEYVGTGSLGANLTRNLGPYRPLLGQLTFGGVFERHPDLRVVFTEGGASWAAQTLTDMDYIYRTYNEQLKPRLTHKPSAYWHRQCATTFMYDPVALRLTDILGADNILWSLDYPHTESVYGFAGEIAEDIWNKLGASDAAKVIGANAARIWGIAPLH